jgi:hypothetical protein
MKNSPLHPDIQRAFLAAILLGGLCVPAAATPQSTLIDGALLPAPETLKDGATIVLDMPGAKRVILRQGTNDMICRANTLKNGFNTICYPKMLDAFWTRNAALTQEGKTDSQIRDALAEDARTGRLNAPIGATTYEMVGGSQQSSLPHMAVFLPNATAQSSGLPDQWDHFRPWLMWAGTPVAHVMIPGK